MVYKIGLIALKLTDVIMVFLTITYALLAILHFCGKQYGKGIYWLGATAINLGIMRMK